jgi:hypothetical protein
MITAAPPQLEDQLTLDELVFIFLPLRVDYQRLAVATADLGYRERSARIRQRLTAYSDALRLTLSNGVEDASFAVRGRR